MRNLDEFGQEYRNAHAETLKALGMIGNNVKLILAFMEREFANQSEMVTVPLNPSSSGFKANGYKFNSLFVTDGQVTNAVKLVINVYGGTYTKTLQAGENVVNIPDGAEISVTNNNNSAQSFLLQRFNYLKQ